MIPPRSPFIPPDDGNVGEVVSNAQSTVYNASQRGCNRLSFDRGTTPSSPGLIPANDTKETVPAWLLLFPNNRLFSCGVTRFPPCYFKLVATRPTTTQLKPTPRTRWAGRRQVNGSRRLFRRTAGLGLRAFRIYFSNAEPRAQAVGSTDEMHVAAFPTFIDFSLANHPSNFTDHSMAPEIFYPPTHVSEPREITPVPACPVLGVTSVRYRWTDRLSRTMIRFLDEKPRFPQTTHPGLVSCRERGGEGDLRRSTGNFNVACWFHTLWHPPLSTDPYRVAC